MDIRFWFYLSEILALAEHACSCTIFAGPGEYGRRPGLLVDTRSEGVIGSNGRSAVPVPATAAAIHVDYPVAARCGQPTPVGYLYLTHADPDDELWEGPALLDQLRHATAGGACWFTIDVHPDASFDYATHRTREVAAAPATAKWVAAWAVAGDLGPYPAQVARGYHRPGGFVHARFSRDIAWWIALDVRCHPAGQRPAQGIRVTGEQVALIRHPGTGPECVKPLTADPDGWWRLDAWQWTLADDHCDSSPDNASLWQTWGPDGEQRCIVCHAVDDFDGGELPSMVGYGADTWTRCRRCGSTEISDPMFGLRQHPASWPPPPDRQRDLDAQTLPDTGDGTRP